MNTIIVSIMIFTLASCEKDENKGLTCTIYLNGNVWSEQSVTNCSACIAPQGYSSSCN